MSQVNLMRRAFLGALVSAGTVGGTQLLFGEEPISRDKLKEPVVRVSKKTNDVQGGGKAPAVEAHPLDPALDIARGALKHSRETVNDYTCYIVKRERISGTLYDQETMFAKVRNRKLEDGQVKVPLSVYMYFMKPEPIKGREVLWVEGRNDNKLMAHEAGITGKLTGTVSLPINGMLAMRGNRYPISEIGVENLIAKLIEKGERDRNRDECTVQFRENATINKRKCTVIQVVHPVRREYFDFNLAQIFLDDELQVPVRYAAYFWPAGKDQNPEPEPNVDNLIEEYTYLNIKLNVGLTESDFDVANKEYSFKR